MKPIGCDRPGGLAAQCRPVARQGKLPAAKAFRLAERDKHMSEQREKPQGFMAELDQWTEANVFGPLLTTDEEGEPEELSNEVLDQVKFAVRQKVLESYKNGCKAGAGHVRREFRQPQAKGHQVAVSGVAR
jgi:hypothetical protein